MADWDRVQALFHETLAQPEAERRAHLAAATNGDAALAEEVWSLIEADAKASPLLDLNVAAVAGAVVGSDTGRRWPASFGRYRVESFLGEGGMGVVYAARRDDLDAVVAIKAMGHGALSPARRARFLDERRILAQLNHPGIARLYDADVLPDGTPWFAMEMVEGLSITEYCQSRALGLADRVDLVIAVAEAVSHAHAHLVVHRDLKPSNILVRPDGHVKLLDFGISKQLDAADDPASASTTLTALRLMTPAYAAPEQITGGAVSVQTDVYAIGALLYELVAGRRAFDLEGKTPGEAERTVTTVDPPKPSTAPARVAAGRSTWADLDVICLTALQKDPRRRYASVEALARDLGHLRRGQPIDARPDRWTYRAGKFTRRHWRGLAAAAVVTIGVVALSGFYTWRLAEARAAAEAETARAARVQAFMTSLFEGGDDISGPADDLRVRTLIERGALEAAALDGDAIVQAELYGTLGGLYQKLGDFARAEDLLGRALAQERRVRGDGHPAVARATVALGLLRLEQARLDEAERLVGEGLEAARPASGAASADVARATAALGQVLEARGKTDEAIAAAEQAAAMQAALGEGSAEHVAVLGQLADAHYYAGHYDEADALNQRVLAATRQLYGERHPRVADVLINLGASHVDRGRYLEAEPYYRPALEILRAFHGADHFRVASAETMLGRTLVYQKKFDEGVSLLGHALAVQTRVNGASHPRVASALNDLGSAALQQGRLDDAEARFRRMREIYREIHGPSHALFATATSNLASVFMARQDFGGAESLYREAVAIYSATQGASHLNTGIGRIKLGRALLRQKRHAEAERESLAGHDIVKAQASPTVSWLQNARADLVEAYTALGQPERAAAFK